MCWNYTGIFLSKSGKRQVFYCFHPAAAGAVSTQLRATTGKGNTLQHERQSCCTAVVLCLHGSGPDTFGWEESPLVPQEASYREQYQSLDMNKDTRLKRCFVEVTQGLVMAFVIGPGKRSHRAVYLNPQSHLCWIKGFCLP